MRVVWKYFVFTAWISFALITSLLLFSGGFLLSRKIIDIKSVCDVEVNTFKTSEEIKAEGLVNFNSFRAEVKGKKYLQACYGSKFKVILIIIDALRYDFIAVQKTDKAKIYHNKLTVVHELLKNQNRTRLYKFIADPPTTTMQRLHGLMTGSLPTFIDMGSNFASSEIYEDNLPAQLVENKKKTIFLGDDTWLHLFPKSFYRHFPFPSFNVWDLDTVDTGVKDLIFKEIRKSDWDLLIAHFLGVDHCGHRYGPNHQEMERKLLEMNSVLAEVVDTMDNQTFLFVMGDHGMTEYGDHGGGTNDEVSSALFIYSPVNLISGYDVPSSTRQINLLPTLASILGVPVPFSNLGSLMIDALPSHGGNSFILENKNYVAELFWRNVEQVSRYIEQYSSQSSHFPSSHFSNIIKQQENLTSSAKYFDNDFINFLNSCVNFLKSVQNMCESVWAQFDYLAMYSGLILHAITVVIIIKIIVKMDENFEKHISKQNVSTWFFSGVSISLVLSLLCTFIKIFEGLLLFYFVAAVVSIFLLQLFWKHISVKEQLGPSFYDSWDHISVLMFVVSSLGLFSNSYIISESNLASFFLLTMIWISLLRFSFSQRLNVCPSFKSSWKVIFNLNLFLCLCCMNLIVRGLRYFWQCYEQDGRCEAIKSSSLFVIFSTIIAFNLFRWGVFRILFLIGNALGSSKMAFFFQCAPLLCIVLFSCFWIFDILNSYKILTLPLWLLYIFPQLVIILCFLGIVLLYLFPLSAFITVMGEKSSHQASSNIVLRKKQGDTCVPSLGSLYVAVFLLLVLFTSILCLILLGDKRGMSSVLMFISMGGLLIVLSVLRVARSRTTEQLFEVSWWEVVTWVFSSWVHFYGTGHQPTFSSLQWEPVTIFGDTVPLLVPGTLVLLNTFLSQIVHSLLLPLLFLLPFTVSGYLPRVCTSDECLFAVFKRKTLRRTALFSLLLRYITLHALRSLIAMLSSSIHSRHLMVWKIFAPKFIFEGVCFLVILPSSFLGFVLVEQLSYQIQIYINKKNYEIVTL